MPIGIAVFLMKKQKNYIQTFKLATVKKRREETRCVLWAPQDKKGRGSDTPEERRGARRLQP